jgi:hypothetical protein
MNEKVPWVREWIGLSEESGVELSLTTLDNSSWRKTITDIIQFMDMKFLKADMERAKGSSFCSNYYNRVVSLQEDYFRGGYNCYEIGVLFKIRCDMLDLNARKWSKSNLSLCSLCNLQQDETTVHFCAVCPILKHIRSSCVGKDCLSSEEFLDHIKNDLGLKTLLQFTKHAYELRATLVSEFNF